MPWASGPRGCQRGRLVVENVRTLVQSAAEHCALMRIYEEKDAWKGIFDGYGLVWAIRVEYVIVCESPKVEWFTPKNGVSHGSFYWTRDPLWDGWPVFHDGFAASPNCVDPMMSRWLSTTECLALATIVVVKVDFSDLDQLIINYKWLHQLIIN